MVRVVLAGIFSVFAMTASAAPTLTVAVDRSGEHAHDMAELQNTVDEIAAAQRHWIHLSVVSGGVQATIGDAISDHAVVAALEKTFRGRKDVGVTVTAARGFRFRPRETLTDGKKDRTPYQILANAVWALRQPLPGLMIEDVADGAIVRIPQGSVVELIQKSHLANAIAVKELSPNSAHVAWQNAGTLEKKYTVGKLLRLLLCVPSEVGLAPIGEEAGFVVADNAEYAPFITAVRKAFADGAPFAMHESAAVEMHFVLQDGKPRTAYAPDEAIFGLMNEISDIADPHLLVKRDGDTVMVRSPSSALAAEQMTAVVAVLRKRVDVAVTEMPDGVSKISLAPGAHLFLPLPHQDEAMMAAQIQARASALKIGLVRVVPRGPEQATVSFASKADREHFRNAITRGDHLSLRLVDEAADSGGAPELGSQKLPLRDGSRDRKFLWLKPGAVLTGASIASASSETIKDTDVVVVMIHLNDEGKSLFAAATKEHVGERLAIVIDGVVVAAPTVREPILGGAMQIDGAFTEEEARDLAAKIVPEQGAVPLRIVTAVP